MKTSIKGQTLIKFFESFKAKPYLCSAGVPTIGYGSTFYENGKPVKITDDAITKERADFLFTQTLGKYEKIVKDSITSSIEQHEFDALVSFAYNTGKIGQRLRIAVNTNPDDKTIWGIFLLYDKYKDAKTGEIKPLLGLTRRRNAEAHLYFKNELKFYQDLK
jgi:lysozyme